MATPMQSIKLVVVGDGAVVRCALQPEELEHSPLTHRAGQDVLADLVHFELVPAGVCADGVRQLQRKCDGGQQDCEPWPVGHCWYVTIAHDVSLPPWCRSQSERDSADVADGRADGGPLALEADAACFVS